jgi:hypothetical protein
MHVEQAHDHRVLRVAGLRSNPAYGASRKALGLIPLLGAVGVTLSLGSWFGLVQFAGRSLAPQWTPWAVVGLGLSVVVTAIGLLWEGVRNRKTGPPVTIRVGSSWLQIDDGPRVAFDTVILLQTEPAVLVIASAHTQTVPDPDGRVHHELARALEAWAEQNGDTDAWGAAQEQKRLASLTRGADADR